MTKTRNIKEKYINLFTDFGFKKIFGTEINKKSLISFLNQIIGVDTGGIINLSYMSSEQLDEAILRNRVKVYEKAKAKNPERWSGKTRNCEMIDKLILILKIKRKRKKIRWHNLNIMRQLTCKTPVHVSAKSAYAEVSTLQPNEGYIIDQISQVETSSATLISLLSNMVDEQKNS